MPLGVIPKNENKGEEMTEIVETLHQYVPGCGDHLLKVLISSVLTSCTPLHNIMHHSGAIWRSVSCRADKLSRVNSGNKKDALQGLIPFSSDWHAELTLLQVIIGSICKVTI